MLRKILHKTFFFNFAVTLLKIFFSQPRQGPTKSYIGIPKCLQKEHFTAQVVSNVILSPMKIRNFAIIAHIDHGKSTLADRLMEITGRVKVGIHEEQMLDRNPISRERGITIKLAPVQLQYQGYTLNLVDTPGHVDFSYEVERTLACVEGVVLLVDATQGIQAQTIAHTYKALEQGLTIIPVINKIDRPEAQVEKIKADLAKFLQINENEILQISAKTGQNCENILKAVIEKISSPNGNEVLAVESAQSTPQLRDTSLGAAGVRALIFDSYYDPHRGVIAFVRVFAGQLMKNQNLLLVGSSQKFVSSEVGFFDPELKESTEIAEQQIGYVVTGLKSIKEVRVGDTVTLNDKPSSPLPGYRKTKPMVYAFIFPTENVDYERLVKAMEKLSLNDSSLDFSGIYSQALGPGLRVGFLGLLHAEIVRERLEQEYNLDLVITPAQVEFQQQNNQFLEPITKATVIIPSQYLNAVMTVSHDYRAVLLRTENLNLEGQVVMIFEMPLSELMANNFFDTLKSITSGYGSLDWEFLEFRSVEAAKLEILLNLKPIDEFSQIVVKNKSFMIAQKYVSKLQKLIPRQQYEIKIQARYQNKIIASSRVAPFRKDVTAKLYGGDRTRKDKLLQKQKKGKSSLKQIGAISLPKETFIKLFRV